MKRSMRLRVASEKCSVSSTGRRNTLSTASFGWEETYSEFWLFLVLTSGTSGEAKGAKGVKNNSLGKKGKEMSPATRKDSLP